MRILVLCTGNSCRSQMAEGFLRYCLLRAEQNDDAAAVSSAGLNPQAVHPKAIQVMAEVGIDISGHRSKHLDEFLGDSFDYVITVCDNAARNCPVFPGGGTRLHWPFDDPAAAAGTDDDVLNDFRRVRNEIKKKIEGWLGSLKS